MGKYYKQQRYHSIDGGLTWIADDVYQKGALIEKYAIACNPYEEWVDYGDYICEDCPPIEKWVNVGYICDDCN